MHTFVTSFIDLNQLENRRNDKKTNFYIEKGIKLLSYPYKFIVFIDKDSRQYLENTLKTNQNIHNITFYTINMEDLPVCKMIDKNCVLPSSANPGKDTYNYMSIMISKTYFIDLAIHLNPYNSTHFSWIDLGILHIIKEDEIELFEKSLEKINNYRGEKIRIPGCLVPLRYNNREVIEYKDYPCWGFCGGFFSGDDKSLLFFSDEVLKYLKNLQSNNYITWEINIWVYIYCRNMEKFDWYYGDHNLSMIFNF